jgi:dTDP-4-amino-4,6-dideoxy-D-galactose acyltransferase
MIKELTWDSTLFQRKIGALIIASQKPSQIKSAVDRAKKGGFQYLLCKLKSQDTQLIKLLESLGFYLTDIGVTFALEPEKFMFKNTDKYTAIQKSVTVAARQDIPVLKKMIGSLFTESRFYNDPFFSKKDGDKLYQTWIGNSVIGEVADIVFNIPGSGFITCRKSGKYSGEIVLIGIRKGLRGKGYGKALVGQAMQWFINQNITTVSVRTQLKNISALNFYLHLGFSIKGYDIIFGNIL